MQVSQLEKTGTLLAAVIIKLVQTFFLLILVFTVKYHNNCLLCTRIIINRLFSSMMREIQFEYFPVVHFKYLRFSCRSIRDPGTEHVNPGLVCGDYSSRTHAGCQRG